MRRLVLGLLAFAVLLPGASGPAAVQALRPNILWITSEDNGPEWGAYGDKYATTPNLDKLAARGFRYRTVWSNGPVCGAARTALITGVFPESNGGEHMRSMVRLPEFMRLYPALLRDAGYYTTNNAKTDYNFAEVGKVWDEMGGTAHWKNRPAGKPFFAVFNINASHESQIRLRPHAWKHDVSTVPLPAYVPDTRASREDWAQYYDQLTVMDEVVGQRIAELEAAGLADDTIIMSYGDHGAGLPRSKRTPFNSGLQVGLIAYIPTKFRALGPPEASRPGSESTRLVSFVDLAPTLLSLAGVKPPAWMQGAAFLGPHTAPAPEYLFGFRGRMDERYDLVRSVRDQRYVYIRNYMPHRPHGQHVAYMFETPTTKTWKAMYDAGELKAPQTLFWEPKASEELYDLQADKWEVNNLAASGTHRDVLARLRRALDAHARDVRDVGFMPEYELHRDERTITAYERGHDPAKYDFGRVYAAAQSASDRAVPLARITAGLADTDPLVRYWAATGVLIRGKDGVAASAAALEKLLSDPEPGPQIVAAEALARFGTPVQRDRALAVLVERGNAASQDEHVAMFALYSLSQVPDLPEQVRQAVRALPTTPTTAAGHIRQRENYLPKLIAAAANGIR